MGVPYNRREYDVQAEFLLEASGVHEDVDPFLTVIRELLGRMVGSPDTRIRDSLRAEMSVRGVAREIMSIFKFGEDPFWGNKQAASRSGEQKSLMDPVTWVNGVVDSGEKPDFTGTAFFLNRADVSKVSFPKRALLSEESVGLLEGWQRTVAELTRAEAKLAVAREYILKTPGLDIYRSGPLAQIEKAMRLTEQASLDLMAGKYGNEYVPADVLVAKVAKNRWKRVARDIFYGSVGAALVACGTGMGSPGMSPDSTPIVDATPTLSIHANPDQVGFPTDVDWIKPVNVFDPQRVEIHADQVARYVEERIANDWPSGVRVSGCEWWEAFQDVADTDNDRPAGLMCSFTVPSGGNGYQLLALAIDDVGNPTYLGRGGGIGYFQLFNDQSRPGFVQMLQLGDPNAVPQDIFQVDASGNIIAFLPLGETEWSVGVFGGSKILAAPAPISEWMNMFSEPFNGTMVAPDGSILDANGNPIIKETPPAVEVVDPLAWQEFGSNSEIIATGADLTLWDRTPQEQRFTINQENAEKLHEGLFIFAAMANWHGNDAIRNQFANFMAYEQYLKAHPEQEGAIIFESNYYAGNPNSRSQGKFVEVSEKVDYSQIAVAFEDVGDNPEKDGWINLGGGVVFKMNVIQTNEEANIVQFIFSNRSQFGVPEYGVLGLNSESTSIENGGALVQGLNLFISWGGRMASRDRLSLVGINDDGSWFINFGFDSISKSYMNSMANGTEYIEPVGEELTDVDWDARVLLYNLSNLGAYALMAENSQRG